LVAETGFNSSPVTKGVLFRAVKPAAAVRERAPLSAKERREDPMDYLLKRAMELGAERAKIIDTETVVVAELTTWGLLPYRIASATAVNPPVPSFGVVVVMPDIAPLLNVPTQIGSAESSRPENAPVMGFK
jgi:hypothetical protein